MDRSDDSAQMETPDQFSTTKNRVEDFAPTVRLSVVWTVLSLAMTVAGFLMFLLLHSQLGGSVGGTGLFFETGIEGDSTYVAFRIDWVVLAIITACVGVLALHEAIHAAGFWYFGGRPEFGATLVQRFLPALYCTAPGYHFTRFQFALIILGPAVVITLLGIAAMPFVDNGMLIAAPLAINFGGAVGDLWMFGMLLRRPRGTMIEDHKEGLRFHFPLPSSAES